ncbi:MAG: hypothetical protein CSYNP_03343 [Syntrophus sp. SKADARSKE-3]|nr:hypothetical protein [Syntrophus sp. SKADARSKE-3]
MDSIFYGKAGDITTNRLENQEISLFCLHLLQTSLVYINTLMIQRVLGDPIWLKRMTARDLAALSPLLTLHINPYGLFGVNIELWLALDAARSFYLAVGCPVPNGPWLHKCWGYPK